MRLNKIFLPAILGVCIALNIGCAGALIAGGAAAGAGAAAYAMGELKATDQVSISRAYAASENALRSLEFRIAESEKDAINARLVAYGVNDKKITVNLNSVTTEMTEVRIRVDVFGDEALSERILREIRARY